MITLACMIRAFSAGVYAPRILGRCPKLEIDSRAFGAKRHTTYTRSFNCVVPDTRAQWTQQKIFPFASTPWPTIRQLQCGQTGASAWIAHSKLSKVWCFPPTTTSNALSYSFSQTSHVGIYNSFAREAVSGGV
jgi:hypothetical protein